MSLTKLKQWMNDHSIDESLATHLALLQKGGAFSNPKIEQNSAESQLESAKSQPLSKCRSDAELEFLDRKITSGLELDTKLNDLDLFIIQSRATNRSLNDTKNQIFSTIKSISESSSELFAERSNLSHLRLEIDMNRAYFIDMETFKVKMAFINQVRFASDFYKYNDNYFKIIQKTVQSFTFFSNRKSYLESSDQLDKYDHLIRKSSDSIAKIFESYHLPYFEQLKQWAAGSSLQSTRDSSDFLQGQFLDTSFKTKHIIVPYFKLLGLLKRDYKAETFSRLFEGKLSDSEESVKSSLCKIVLGLELQSNNSDKIQELFRFFFSEPIFEEYRKSVWTFYTSHYLKYSLKMFESICACEKELASVISYMLTDLLLTTTHLSDYLGENYFKSDVFNSSMSSYISSLINTFKQRIKNEDDFNLIITLFRSVIANYRITEIFINTANELDKAKPFESELRMYIYRTVVEQLEESTQLVSNLNFYCQQLITGLCETLLFQTEYMLNKIVNQQWKSTNNAQEVANFDLTQKNTLVQEFSKAFKIFDYICVSLESLHFGYENLKGYIYKLALLTMKRVIESSSLIRDDLVRFAFRFKNLYAVFRKLSKDVSFESVYEFHETFYQDSDLIPQIDKELNKQSTEYLYLFCAQLTSQIINNEVIRLSQFFILEGSRCGFKIQEFSNVIEKTLNEVKLKLTLCLNFDALAAAQAIFLPSLVNISTQSIISHTSPEDLENTHTIISNLFSSALSPNGSI